MAFDALGILKGLYGGVLVSTDESDVAPISKTPNSDGNAVVELNGTGLKGLAAVMVCTGFAAGESALFINTDSAIVTIEASDSLVSNWEEVARFPKLYNNILEFYITATTGFVQADIGQLVTQETTADTGYLISFDPALAAIGGIGKIRVAVVDSGDVFNEAAGKTVNSAGTGRATKTYGAGTTVAKTMIPGIYITRFVTNKKYVRCNCALVLDAMGLVWIMLTDGAFLRL
jgi:hypothetical protein